MPESTTMQTAILTIASILCDDCEIAVGADNSMSEARPECRYMTRSSLINKELEWAATDWHSIVGHVEIVQANLSRSVDHLHRAILVVNEFRLLFPSGRSRHFR